MSWPGHVPLVHSSGGGSVRDKLKTHKRNEKQSKRGKMRSIQVNLCLFAKKITKILVFAVFFDPKIVFFLILSYEMFLILTKKLEKKTKKKKRKMIKNILVKF